MDSIAQNVKFCLSFPLLVQKYSVVNTIFQHKSSQHSVPNPPSVLNSGAAKIILN